MITFSSKVTPDGDLNFQIPDVESVSPNDAGANAEPSTK